MNSRFTQNELRLAITAMFAVERYGSRDELDRRLLEVRDMAPNANWWGNATPRQEIEGGRLARQVANLLGESRDRCNQAAAELIAPQRHWTTYNTLINYAAELSANVDLSEEVA